MKLAFSEKGTLEISAESPEEKDELNLWANSRKEWLLVCKLLLKRIEKLEGRNVRTNELGTEINPERT